MKIRAHALVTGMAIIGLALISGDGAEAASTLKFGTVAPANTPWADALADIQKRVEKDSGGNIKIKTYLGGQLGGEIEILRGIRSGRIEGGGLSTAALASAVPELDVIEIPFLFDSDEEADYVLDTCLFDPFKKLFDQKGLVLVSWAENGWRDIGLKTKVVHSPADLKDVKVRSQESKTHLAFWKRLGANPVPIAIPEVLSALQTGIVAGFDNTPLFTLAAEWHSAIKYYTHTRHIYQPAAVVYSKKVFDKLSASDQKVLIGDGNALAVKARKDVRALTDQLLTVLKESGVEVYRLSPSEREGFKKALRGLDQELLKTIGGQAREIYDMIQKCKKDFTAKKS